MPDAFIRPRQRASTAVLPHQGNPNVLVPKRRISRTTMLVDTLAVKTGFSTIFLFGTMTPKAALGRDIVQVTHDSTLQLTEIVIAQTFAGELAENFWYSVTFDAAVDPNWDGFTLLRSDNSEFVDTDPAFSIWNFASRDFPFIDGESYLLTWRRQ